MEPENKQHSEKTVNVWIKNAGRVPPVFTRYRNSASDSIRDFRVNR